MLHKETKFTGANKMRKGIGMNIRHSAMFITSKTKPAPGMVVAAPVPVLAQGYSGQPEMAPQKTSLLNV